MLWEQEIASSNLATPTLPAEVPRMRNFGGLFQAVFFHRQLQKMICNSHWVICLPTVWKTNPNPFMNFICF